MPRSSFREQMLRVREDAIVTAVNRLLAEKGFDLMTVDQVAAEVGIAKASLYKHFPSKEALAAAAMVRVMEQGLQVVDDQAARHDAGVLDRLQAVARWALQMQLAGQMPTLPSQNSSLRSELATHARYMDLLMEISDKLGAWIVEAQRDGHIDASLPAELVLYTLYARACDPVPAVLKSGGRFSDDEVVEWVLQTCFSGLSART
ncbi:MAG: TetR/AcrR family transcriptional regulator [Betaproteobacteria bacterium]|jgi:TetR/AcrR family transcriptional regulator, regulator of autoinduction and epiphytic fitness|nr:TetR/AcrR family transcriptional regulator [Betaproteobacteria bacterium]